MTKIFGPRFDQGMSSIMFPRDFRVADSAAPVGMLDYPNGTYVFQAGPTGGGASDAPLTRAERAVATQSMPRAAKEVRLTPTGQDIRGTKKNLSIQISKVYKNDSDTIPETVGRFYLAGNRIYGQNITHLPVDITVVPQWHADQEHGGGARGGVAQAWMNRATELRTQGKPELADKVEAALHEYEDIRDSRHDHALHPGYSVVRSLTNVTDRSIPRAFLNIASVPDAKTRLQSGADQCARMTYIERVLSSTLHHVEKTIEKLGLEPSLDKPVRIAMPLICSGPDGAGSYAEVAALMYKILGNYMSEHPGIEFIIPVRPGTYANEHMAEELAQVEAIFRGDSAILASIKERMPLKPKAMFEILLKPFLHAASSPTDIVFNQDYFDKKYHAWQQRFQTACDAVPAQEADKAALLVDQFHNNAERICASELHQYAALLSSNLDEHGYEAKPLQPAKLYEILRDGKLRERAFDIFMDQLQHRQQRDEDGELLLSIDDKMNELMGAAMAAAIHERISATVNDIYQLYKDQIENLKKGQEILSQRLAQQSQALHETEARMHELETQNLLKEREIDDLGEQMITQHEVILKADEEQKAALKEQQRKFAQEKKLLRETADNLRREIADLQAEVTAQRKKIGTMGTSSSSLSSGYSSYHSGG